MQEIWKDVVGYEGRYQVSNLGRVKSLSRERLTKGGGVTMMPERIMKIHTMKDTGRSKPYAQICLRNGIMNKTFLVHRLVAESFIRPIKIKEQIDHINGIHADNRVENLRILSVAEHTKLHPVFVNPLPRNIFTGQIMPRGSDPATPLNPNNKKLTAAKMYHVWFLTNVSRQNYFGA